MLLLQKEGHSHVATQVPALHQVNKVLLWLLIPLLGWGLPVLTGYNHVMHSMYFYTACFGIALAYLLFMVNRKLFYHFLWKHAAPSVFIRWWYRLKFTVVTLLICLPLLTLWRWKLQQQSIMDGSVVTTMAFVLLAVSFIQTIYAALYASHARNSAAPIVPMPNQDMLQVLQQQLKAHFVCNALNTLQYLITSNKQEALAYNKALGQMYRHLMYSSTLPLVSLQEELLFVQDYVYVQSFRYRHKTLMQHRIDEDVLLHYRIPPLALQVIVENVLAYSNHSNQEQWIQLHLEDEYLVIRNTICPGVVNHGHGVALANLQQQYHAHTHLPVKSYASNNMFVTAIPLLSANAMAAE